MSDAQARIVITGVDRTQTAFAAAGRNVQGLSTQVGAMAARALAVAPALAAGVAAIGMASASKVLDQLDEIAEKTGITVEELSALRYASEAAGTSFDQLNPALQRLSRLMADAAGGNKEAVATFRDLGVQVRGADGSLRSVDQVLLDVASRFQTYEDGAGKSALAQRVFGKSGTDLIPILNQGREGIERLRKEAEQLGAVYSGEYAKAAGEFNDNLNKLRLAAEAAAVAIGGPLIASVSRFTEELIQGRKVFGGFGEALLQIGLKTSPFDNYTEGAARARKEVQQLEASLAALQGRGPRVQDTAGGAALLAPSRGRTAPAGQVAALQAQIADARKRAEYFDSLRRFDGARGVGFTDPRLLTGGKKDAPLPPDPSGAKKDPDAEAKRYLDNLQKQAERLRELTAEEQFLLDKQLGRLSIVNPELERQILAQARQLDETREYEAGLLDVDKAAKQFKESQDALKEAALQLASTVATPWERLSAELQKIEKVAATNPFLSEEAAKRLQGKAWSDYFESFERGVEAIERIDEFSRRAAENIQDYLGSSLADILDGDFKSIGDSFMRMLNRMVAEAAAAQLSRHLFGGMVDGGQGAGLLGGALRSVGGALFGGGASGGPMTVMTADQLGASFDSYMGGSAGGFLSKLFSFDGGGYTGSGPRAGGLDGKGGFLAMVHPNEDIIDRTVAAAGHSRGGGDIRVVNNYHLAAPTDRRTQAQISTAAVSGVQRAHRRNT